MKNSVRSLAIGIVSLVAVHAGLAEEESQDWFTNYYKNPEPDKLAEEVRSMRKAGNLADEGAYPPIVAFLSRIMADNPKKVTGWLEELSDEDEKQRAVVLPAAWYSNTPQANAFFKKRGLESYVAEKAPDILLLEVNDPGMLDMLWGYFMATGDEKPIRRIVSAFRLSKYSGALDRYRSSEKTEEDKKAAYLEATFQAALWSMESNCRQHPLVLEHCEAIFADPKLSKPESLYLGMVLSKVKPDKYQMKTEDGKSGNEIDPAKQGR